MTDKQGLFEVSFATGHRVNMDEIRRRRSAFMPDNGHAWVISTVHALDDPEQALDEMTLDAATFVGVTAIYCLVCNERYDTAKRFHKCPQRLVIPPAK